MPLQGEYEPSPLDWVREQVEEYEASNGERANTLRDTGLPVVIITTRGRTSGKIRKFPLMRVEHGGESLPWEARRTTRRGTATWWPTPLR
jgi:hypothetical protein